MPLHHPRAPSISQNGSTLITSLMILILIMLLGVTAMVTSDTQFKLAGNIQFQDSALNNAETAISNAENWLATGTNYLSTGFQTFATATAYQHPKTHLSGLTAPANDPLTMTWSDSNSVKVANNENQRYLIELVSENVRLQGSSQTTGGRASAACNMVNTYQITARGQSARGTTKFVQSYFSVLSC